MNITKFSIDNSRVTLMILAVIAIMGLVTYGTLSRNSMPPYTIRIATVVTQFPGASPDRVEQLITKKIEETVQELPELDDVTSESRTGLSVVTVSLTPDIAKEDLQVVWDRLRRKIEGIQNELPDGSRSPKINDDGFGTVYGIMLGLEGDGFSNAEMREYAEDIRDDLVKLDAAAEVEIKGELPEQIYVEFDNARLAELGLTASRLQSTLSVTNIVYSGGQVGLENKRIALEPSGNFESVQDLERTLITLPSGNSIPLGDIANITRGYKSPTEKIVRINGEPGIAIAIALKEGANLIELGEFIDEKVAGYNRELPVGLSVARMAGQDLYVDQKVSDFLSNVFQSVGIVLVVMLLFLGFRTGIVVASLIPMAMIMTLWIMGMFDIGLNQVSLAALIMALGLLVDNAIVVSESIMVKMEEGQTALNAAINASGELFTPLLVSSLTTSAAFLAFFLAENTMGEMMGPLFSVITITLLCSWILAMTMIPFLGFRFIRVQSKETADKPGMFDRLTKSYKGLLTGVLHRPWLFTLGIVVLFFGSLSLFGNIPFIFFPDSDRNLVTLDMNLPLGTKIEETERTVNQIENYIRAELLVGEGRDKGITDWSAFIGEGPSSYDLGYQPGEANSGYGHLLLNTSSFLDNNLVIAKLEDFCFEQLPDAEVDVSPLSGGGGGGKDVEIRVSGDSPKELFLIAEEVKQLLLDVPGTRSISDNWGPQIKKFVIDIDQDNANRAGLSNQDIAISLQTTLDGFNAGSYREGDENIPIMMRTINSDDLDIRDLNGINLFAQNSGSNVPLQQVASINPQWQNAKILRRNLFRTITISCDAMPGYTASELTSSITPLLKERAENWKSGYAYSLGGESEQSSEAMGAVIAKLPLSGFIILLLLVLQFNSFRKTSIVLLTIPLGIIGVIFGLLLFQSFFGFMAFLGVISLAGIVINNAIVLLDRIQIEIDDFNRTPYEAIVEAAQQRFRPILLTTFTTTLGLIPLYLGGGEMWEPMAISIMIGLLFATVITLLFVPVLYKLLFRAKPATTA
ncbi:MAG: efflux RND transporter permease subunit [Saprospiraceae bacterium]|nr:efflux RND transporter permease subunit [Saprospiraceae bacterium]